MHDYNSPEESPPPPPYRATETTAVIAETASRSAAEETNAPPDLPTGSWDLVLNTDKGPLLQLRGTDQTTVTYQNVKWTCESSSTAGRLLSDPGRQVCVRRLRQHLVVFEQTKIHEGFYPPPPKPMNDQTGPLKVETASSGILTVTGAVIHQVEGDGDDIVIVTLHQAKSGDPAGSTTQNISLWDMKKGKWRWKVSREGSSRIWGFTEDFILIKVGEVHLRRRKDGKTHGSFPFPSFIYINPDHHHGPITSENKLFLYKPCKKAVLVWQVQDKSVRFRIWESADDIQGPLALRGSLDDLELTPVGQQCAWTCRKAMKSGQ
ncbi:hypothetical protein LY76DRAFT_645578 [Colletotrichum caudatum]|nr:hypothetical protein LY76DRAFT_645578 [Colletotrichum caudatum]